MLPVEQEPWLLLLEEEEEEEEDIVERVDWIDGRRKSQVEVGFVLLLYVDRSFSTSLQLPRKRNVVW